MPKLLRTLCLMALAVLVIAANSYGQDENQPRRGRRGQGQGFQRDPFRLPRQIELSEDQKSKLEEIKKKHEEKLKAAQEKAQPTEEQRGKLREAFQQAREDGKRGEELRKAVDEAVGFTDEQKKAREELQAIVKEVTTEVEALLTDDQKARLKELREQRGRRGRQRANPDAA